MVTVEALVLVLGVVALVVAVLVVGVEDAVVGVEDAVVLLGVVNVELVGLVLVTEVVAGDAPNVTGVLMLT